MDYFECEYDFRANMTSNVKMISSKVDLKVWISSSMRMKWRWGWFKVSITLSVKMISNKVDFKVFLNYLDGTWSWKYLSIQILERIHVLFEFMNCSNILLKNDNNDPPSDI